ncbi:TetR/AcrR family transcriptional regulator [Nocardioides plantarum]|uniref:TetR/AcrR family transcriptional regulator n=1 Tax=Nocardioides plantarum TaxID=29299 RepID=UPI00111D1750|nr:TetR/AcrR family transcriptional regulator [Nocardioides plantarum]
MPYRRTLAVQERLDATRASLVAAAHALVAERGYAGCSIALVAAGAGVATGTVYRHFPDKGALFAEVFRGATQREVDAVAAAVAGPGSVAERVGRAVETFARRALASPRLAYALIAEPVDPQVEVERLTYRRAYRDIFAALIDDAVVGGHLPVQDAQVSAAAVVGAMAEALVSPLHAVSTGSTTDRVVPELTAFVTRSIGAIS